MKNELKRMNESETLTSSPIVGINPLGMPGGAMQPGGALASVMNNQSVVETLASIWIAKQMPRDLALVTQRVNESCARYSLASIATYAYTRGNSTVTGPSIRLAEVLMQAWGNLEAGWRKVAQHFDPKGNDGKGCQVAECTAWAWDKETNTKSEIAFDVPLVRETKQGNKALTSERDIYEFCANMASRRMRACILRIIPGWMVDEAMEKITATLERGDGKPLADRVRSMVANFGEYGVTSEMIEAKLGHSVKETTRQELVALGREFNAIRDGVERVKDVFPEPAGSPMAASKPQPATQQATGAAKPMEDGKLPIA